MSRTALKGFQDRVVENAAAVFGGCLSRLAALRSSADYAAQRPLVVRDAGALLIEAPTGIGKTLMAAHAVGRVNAMHRAIWLWFAPFGSVVAQTAGVLAEEVEPLRVRDPHDDRAVEELRPGDVFLSTWAAVAVSDTEIRKTRSSTERLPSLDLLLEYARAEGYFIGAVIDEAHHSFRGDTKAFEFFRTIVDPDLTLLITATPKDAEIEVFKRTTHLGKVRRITVPRREGVEARLLKTGIKTAVFRAPADAEELLDFKATALRQATAVHRRLKAVLEDAGLAMTPLMMVQVDSSPDAEKAAVASLKELGFRPDQIMVHTAKEPDPTLNAVQGDENVEVLVFKMAVALGFDAPRAFTLVSFRVSRDEDFGLQIVGRLMRVDRRLQRASNHPPELDYGYVFLSDKESQTGILSAGDRINSIKSELASLETNVSVTVMGEGGALVVPARDGQPELPMSGGPRADGDEAAGDGPGHSGIAVADRPFSAGDLFGAWGFAGGGEAGAARYGSGTRKAESFVAETPAPLYALRTGSGLPTRFKRAEIDVLGHDILSEVTDRFRWDAEVFNLAKTDGRKILMESYEIFSHIKDAPEEIRAKLAKRELSARAQLCLEQADRDGFLDKRVLYDALLSRLAKEADGRGLTGFESRDELGDALARVLALRPSLLSDAVSETFARHTVASDAAPLPDLFDSENPLSGARLNLYGVFPGDLNTWERPFAELIDNDLSQTVAWWHRNPVRKAHSVSIPIPGHGFFFPDLIVGINGRTTTNGVILVEIKHQINDPEGNAAAKSRAVHPDYGPVLMLYFDERNREWRTVVYDRTSDRNILDRGFRIEMLKTW